MFIINIPTVEQHELILYHLLPLPVYCKNNKYVYIKSNYDFIANSISNAYYTTFSKIQIFQCKQTKEFSLCPRFQPIQPKTNTPLCDVELFLQPSTTPIDCKLIYFELDTSLFSQIKI